MAINAPNSTGLQSLNLRSTDASAGAGVSSRGIGGYGQGRIGGDVGAGSRFDGEAVLAADAWEGGASRSLSATNPSDFAEGPNIGANVERDVDFILSAL